jgi:tRNA A37 threonylcarbamoyltransferase TsaD
MNFHNILFYLEDHIESLYETYEYSIIFRSFEEAIFRLIESKLKDILCIIPCRQISIVGGVSQNDDFFNRISQVFEKSGCIVTRPDPEYRFDNAAML